MKKFTTLIIFISFLISCQEKMKESDISDGFEKSYKAQKDEGNLPEHTEHFDSLKNIYSNFKYRFAFDAPDNWASDAGVSEHTIFRTYQADSAITFTINVIEIQDFKNSKSRPDIWELYQANKDEMDYPYKVIIPKQFKSEVKNFVAKKSYIKNQLSLKRSFSYMVRELDYEYSLTSIVYQTYLDKFTYTFKLDVPTMFYKENPDYYEDLFLNVYFLLNKEDINKFMNQKTNQMDNRLLVNEINSLKESIETMIYEMQLLRDELEKTREDNSKLKFRMSELENSLDRQ